MIIIEASHIYYGGGFSLLLELIKYLSKEKQPYKLYIAHKVIYNELKKNTNPYMTLVLTNTWDTLLRYSTKRSNVIFFLNLPPFVKNTKSVVYFHNELILEDKFFRLKNVKLFIYCKWLKWFNNKVDTIACQTENIAVGLKQIGVKHINKLPFFDDVYSNNSISKKYTFCYVCSGALHKNVERLFEAIDQIKDKYSISLAVTIENTNVNESLLKKIENINRNAGRNVIINLGLVSKTEVMKIYQASEALVFPSLKESLGLPLIEANMCGIKVLSSDLLYSYEVLSSPIVFNPYESKEIAKTLESFLNGKYNDVVQKVRIKNKIEELINLVI